MRYQNPAGAKPSTATLKDFWTFFKSIRSSVAHFESQLVDWISVLSLSEQLSTVGEQDYLAWLGHASYLFRQNGVVGLIDPFFSERASPFSWIGPRRLVPPPIAVHELPGLSLILLTHNHYDHLDMPFLQSLSHREQITLVVPSGLGISLAYLGWKSVVEVAWEETYTFEGLKITALPAYHYSKRTLWDKNRSHWCGWLMDTGQKKYYHAGDTGYGSVFREIGKRYGPMDMLMVGIGAYDPAAIMSAVHTTPEEALQLVLDVGTSRVCPMHWGVIPLSLEPMGEPLERFKFALAQLEQPPALALTQVGEVLVG